MNLKGILTQPVESRPNLLIQVSKKLTEVNNAIISLQEQLTVLKDNNVRLRYAFTKVGERGWLYPPENTEIVLQKAMREAAITAYQNQINDLKQMRLELCEFPCTETPTSADDTNWAEDRY